MEIENENMELRNRALEEETELALGYSRESVGKLNGTFKELKFPSMANMELSSLAQLPSLNKLHKLELSDNIISGDLEVLAEKCLYLYQSQSEQKRNQRSQYNKSSVKSFNFFKFILCSYDTKLKYTLT